MAKRRRQHPGPDYYKVQGSHVEDRDAAKASKQALDREAARRRQKGRGKAARPAAKRARAARPEPIVVPESLQKAHDRQVAGELARLQRQPPKRVKRAAPVRSEDYPTHVGPRLGARARGVVRRVARMALAPLALARAVVDRFRRHE